MPAVDVAGIAPAALGRSFRIETIRMTLLSVFRGLTLAFVLSVPSLPAFAAHSGSGVGGLWTAAVSYNGYETDPMTGQSTGVIKRVTVVLVASSQTACQIQVNAYLQNTYSAPSVVRPCQLGMVNLEQK